MHTFLFDAVIFDLDGVITKTALVHSAAWKRVFNEFLLMRAERFNEPFVPFTHEHDYLGLVDGKPRYDGVKAFLASRNIEVPFGSVDDPPSFKTICGIGNSKNKAFNEVLENQGVDVYESTVKLIKELRSAGIRTGVASSSKNCAAVLERAGLTGLFETRVDGVVSAELKLNGKPEPDIFTTAARNLGASFDKTVVVEDAVSGVQAGRKGNFGLVLGIARENNEKELRKNGADIVVNDLAECGMIEMNHWFAEGLKKDNWTLSYYDYDPDREKTRESLLTVGNGYFGTRGAGEENQAGSANYPGTYIAGLYNRLTSTVGDREVENEDFVNCPNWTCITFSVDEGDWFDINKAEILHIARKLDLRTGVFLRELIVKDLQGRQTGIVSERFASMDNPHLGGLKYSITPLNYSGKITVKTGIDGNIINDGVERYRQLNQKHLQPVSEECRRGQGALTVHTTNSDIMVTTSVRQMVLKDGEAIQPLLLLDRKPGRLFSSFSVDMEPEKTLTVEKTIAIFTSQPWDSDRPEEEAFEMARKATPYGGLLQQSVARWEEIWDKIDVNLEGDRLAQKLLRLHLYHLMVSFSPHNAGFDASITARGLHGEAYRGHIFWDELFIMPLYNVHFPETARAALLYRFNRLDKAREYAKQHGCKGAMFPWQSGSDGREETQVVHLNPLTGKWGADHSSLQRHVSLAIAYNTWNYIHYTGDQEFIRQYGAEMFLEICRFWASKAEINPANGRYDIDGVMGPDEFHEKYPGAEEGGLRNNAYTNIMAAWMFEKAEEILGMIPVETQNAIRKKIDLPDNELQRWKKIASSLNFDLQGDIIAQYDGYFELEELDWEYFRKKYGNVYRMDRLLKAEGKSADHYKVAKQADTLMTFYNLDHQVVADILRKNGYTLSDNFLQQNLWYYLQRTSHGSSLSRVVHAHLANLTGDKELSRQLYLDALTSDYNDIQGGTTGEGIHTGVMAGTVLVALRCYAGLVLSGDIPGVFPNLPEHWKSIGFKFSFKRIDYRMVVEKNKVKVVQHNPAGKPVGINVRGAVHMIESDKEYTIELL